MPLRFLFPPFLSASMTHVCLFARGKEKQRRARSRRSKRCKSSPKIDVEASFFCRSYIVFVVVTTIPFKKKKKRSPHGAARLVRAPRPDRSPAAVAVPSPSACLEAEQAQAAQGGDPAELCVERRELVQEAPALASFPDEAGHFLEIGEAPAESE